MPTKQNAIPSIKTKNVRFPTVDGTAYALEITGNSMLPVYREGDTIIVSPQAALRKGDRVVVKTTDGKVIAKIMQRKTAKQVELVSFNAPTKQVVEMKDVEWMARIIWASQ
jgi:phage repressor protein C with HTH and peptisase S24 domain